MKPMATKIDIEHKDAHDWIGGWSKPSLWEQVKEFMVAASLVTAMMLCGFYLLTEAIIRGWLV